MIPRVSLDIFFWCNGVLENEFTWKSCETTKWPFFIKWKVNFLKPSQGVSMWKKMRSPLCLPPGSNAFTPRTHSPWGVHRDFPGHTQAETWLTWNPLPELHLPFLWISRPVACPLPIPTCPTQGPSTYGRKMDLSRNLNLTLFIPLKCKTSRALKWQLEKAAF